MKEYQVKIQPIRVLCILCMIHITVKFQYFNHILSEICGVLISPKMYSAVMCALCWCCCAELSMNCLWLGKYCWKDNLLLSCDSSLRLLVA